MIWFVMLHFWSSYLNKVITIIKKIWYAFHVGTNTTNKSPTFSLLCRVIIEYSKDDFYVNGLYFEKNCCLLRWRLSLILINIYFRFLKFWNGSSTLYIQIIFLKFVFCCYMYSPLNCIMCCNSLFSLRLCTYIFFVWCEQYMT